MTDKIRNVYDLLRTDKAVLDLGAPMSLPTKEPLEERPKDLLLAQNIAEAEFLEKPKRGEPVKKNSKRKFTLIQKDYVKYPLIFVVSFVFFYLILNSGAIYIKLAALVPEPEQKPQTEGQVLGVTTPEYTSWIGKYFFYANNLDALSPNFDFDRDGLTNYQEFLLHTNPTKQDTDNDGYIDGQEVLNGYNPLHQGKLRASQEELIAGFDGEDNEGSQGWDLRMINNRISYYAVSSLSQGPAKPSDLPVINYNLDKPAELSIPKLGVKAPVIWSRTEATFDDDLDRGLVHYPGTSLPGQTGVTYISGHSSNYVWRTSSYSHVFARLNELNAGDEFFITLYRADDSMLTLRYVVFAENKYKPDDQAQFTSAGNESIVNLSTCWPLGTTSERYVVSARLTGA